MGKVALIVIYNHQYNKNITVVEELYKNRFDDIFHLVPFYEGDKSNVIAVYDNSYYFQGYVAQGFDRFYNEKYEHYFFIGDDLILNPLINQDNYKDHYRFNKDTCFIPSLLDLEEVGGYWRGSDAAYHFDSKQAGIEITGKFPSDEEAKDRFARFNLKISELDYSQIWNKPQSLSFKSLKSFASTLLKKLLYGYRRFFSKVFKTKYKIPYPFVGSYSDIFIISADSIKYFCHLCGIFSSARLFVEVAIPTAIVLSAREIVTEKDLPLQGRALWTPEESKVLDPFESSLNKLLNNFPSNFMYLHPIKLSKWKA